MVAIRRPPSLVTSGRRRLEPGAVAILSAAGAAAIGMGLLSTASSLRLHAAGVPTWTIGLVATSHYAGIALGCLLCVPLSRRIGRRRALALSTLLLFVAAAGQILAGPIASWVAVRVLAGLGVALLMGVIESWAGSRPSRRSRVALLTSYVAVVQCGLLASQLSIAAVDMCTLVGRALPMAIFALAVGPFVVSRQKETEATPVRSPLPTLLSRAPMGLLGTAASGIVVSSLLVMTPVFGADLGMPPVPLAILLAAFVLGGALFPIPIGRASDVLDRRVVMGLAACGLALASGAAAALHGDRPNVLVALAVVIGGLGASIYPVAVAHANDELPPSQRGGAADTLLLAWAGGSALGPALASLAMQRLGPSGLFTFVCAAALAFGAAAVAAAQRRP